MRESVWRRSLSGRAAALLFFVLLGYSRVEAECVDPAAFVQATASITRHFSDDERRADTGLLGIHGTAWFLSPSLMATAGHVAEEMHLSGLAWTQIEIAVGGEEQSISVRIQRLAGSGAEKIALLELRTGFPRAQSFQTRARPLVPGEPLVSLAYPSSTLRFAKGRFVRQGDDDKVSGMALLEMVDGDDRLVLDHGASGAPVLDCEGRVVAVVSNIFATTLTFMSQAIRISTAWGSPNVASVPIAVLEAAP